MSWFESRHEVGFNLPLFKSLRFYHIFDPRGAKIRDYNIYRLVCVSLTFFVIAVNLYGLLGFIVKMEHSVDEIESIRILYAHMHCFLGVFKMSVCVRNADNIWNLLDVTRINFIKSVIERSEHGTYEIFYEHQRRSIKITNFLYGFLKTTILVWMIFPLLINVTAMADGRKQRRYESVLNFRFPIATRSYNGYLFLIYIFELQVLFVLAYSWLIVNILFVSIFYVFAAQYEMYAMAVQMIGREEKQYGKHIERRQECCIVDSVR